MVPRLDTAGTPPYTPSAMPPRWRATLADVTPYVPPPPLAALEAEVGGPISRLSANENPLGPSPLALEAIRDELPRLHLYPDGGAPLLRETAAAVLGVRADQLLFGNGADEIISLLARALLEPGDQVIVPDPAFEVYATTARVAGATVVRSPLRDYRIDLEDVLARLTPQTKLVWLASPHNPTGTVLPRAPWERFLARCPDDVLVALDEAYVDFVQHPEAVADGLRALPARPEGLLVLRTFSKLAGLAGLRVGYAVAGPGIIGALERVREPFNVSRLAQAGASAALRDHAHRDATRRLVWQERRRFCEALAARGLPFVPSEANFVLVRVGADTGPVVAALRARGILVRDGASLGAPGHLRITIGTPAQTDALLAVLDEVLAARPGTGARERR